MIYSCYHNQKHTSKKPVLTILTAALLGSSFLTGCNQRISGHMAEVEYDASVTPYHIVRRNETIASIARHYGIDKRELARLNGLRPPFRIVVGQKLVVRSMSTKKRQRDPYETPAAEGPLVTTGEVSASKLAPLPGMQEDNARIVGTGNTMGDPTGDSSQPFNSPDNMEMMPPPPEEGMPVSSEESQMNQPPEEKKPVAQHLPETPRSASFYAWPVKGKVIKGFTPKKGKQGGHTGIKIAAPKGTPVVAANNGVVARTRQVAGYGKIVLVKHDGGYLTIYSHLDDINVKRGDVVQAGQKIGTVGKTGNAQEPQLHFEIRKNGGKTPVDPTTVLD